EPYMGRYGNEIVQAGMVGAFEPLVYIPGRFGMQNKDMFCVTETGCALLSDYTPTDKLLRRGKEEANVMLKKLHLRDAEFDETGISFCQKLFTLRSQRS